MGSSSRGKGGATRRRGTALSHPYERNDLWCAHYKGEFTLADRRYCYPLTITDFASRYLVACEALATTKESYAFSVFETAFKEFGLVSFMDYDLGYFDDETCRLEPLHNPFGPNVVTDLSATVAL